MLCKMSRNFVELRTNAQENLGVCSEFSEIPRKFCRIIIIYLGHFREMTQKEPRKHLYKYFELRLPIRGSCGDDVQARLRPSGERASKARSSARRKNRFRGRYCRRGPEARSVARSGHLARPHAYEYYEYPRPEVQLQQPCE